MDMVIYSNHDLVSVRVLGIFHDHIFKWMNLVRFYPFSSQSSLLIPLKTSGNQRFSDVFRGIERNIRKKRVKAETNSFVWNHLMSLQYMTKLWKKPTTKPLDWYKIKIILNLIEIRQMTEIKQGARVVIKMRN